MNDRVKSMLKWGGSALALILCVLWGLDWYSDNRDVSLRAEFEAQDKVCQSYFKTMWSTIQDEAKVVEKTSDDFLKIYKPLMEGRYGDEGEPLFEWIAEDNPEYSLETHRKLMVDVNALRTQFHEEQKHKISIKEEHDKLRRKKPYRWFIDDPSEIEMVIITDSYTEETWESGHDERELEL